MRPGKGSRTEENLKRACLDAALLDRRYVRHARLAEREGYHDLARLMREAAEDEAGHARGHLDHLAGDDGVAFAGMEWRSAADSAAMMTEMTDEHTDIYAGMARTAREEGFEEIADWFETLARAERFHSRRLRHVLEDRRAGVGETDRR